MKRLYRAGAPLICAVSVACGGGGGDRWTGSIADSAGIQIVSNGEQGLWSATEVWSMEEILRIGSAGGDPLYQFGQIAGIAVTEDGGIFVLDQQAGEVKGFSASGEWQQTIGRSGAGPGELGQQAGPLLLGAADTLVVPDLANQRVNLFGMDGSMYGSYRVDLSQGIPVRWESFGKGVVVSQLRSFALPNQPAPDTMDAIVARAADGEIIDTLLTMPAGKTFQFSGGAPEFHFFTAEPAWALTPDMEIAYGVNDDYRIGLYDRSGSLARIIKKPFTRGAVTETDKELFTDALMRVWEQAGVPPQALPTLKQGINFNDTYPAYFQFMSGPAGSLWVQHVQAINRMTEDQLSNFNPLLTLGGPEWDVFDNQGRFLGTIEMPTGFQPVRFVGDRIYGIWRDDLEVQHVMALRVVGVPGEDTGGMPVGEDG